MAYSDVEAAASVFKKHLSSIKRPAPFKPSKNKKGQSKKAPAKVQKPVAKEQPKKEEVKKPTPPAPKKDRTPKAKVEPITKGPRATHARDLDTGKAVKLNAKDRKAVQEYYAKRESTPAVNLNKYNTGSQFSVSDKRRIQ